jgi:hypothetical protein
MGVGEPIKGLRLLAKLVLVFLGVVKDGSSIAGMPGVLFFIGSICSDCKISCV